MLPNAIDAQPVVRIIEIARARTERILAVGEEFPHAPVCVHLVVEADGNRRAMAARRIAAEAFPALAEFQPAARRRPHINGNNARFPRRIFLCSCLARTGQCSVR